MTDCFMPLERSMGNTYRTIELLNKKRIHPLEEKKRLLEKIHIPNVTVCEDYTEHYEYWKNNYNPNRDDCCNLRL